MSSWMGGHEPTNIAAVAGRNNYKMVTTGYIYYLNEIISQL